MLPSPLPGSNAAMPARAAAIAPTGATRGRWGAVHSVRTAEFRGPDTLCGAPSRERALATVETWCGSQAFVVS